MKIAFLSFALLLVGCKPKYELSEMPIGIDPMAQLVSHDGTPENLLATGRAINVLFFGFTRCPDFCPLTLHRIDAAVAGSKVKNRLRLIFVSVDVPRDKPGDLKAFLSPFPYARGFTGKKEDIAAIEKQLGAYSKEDAGKLSHSLYIYVLNPAGKVIYLLRHDDPAEKIRAVLEQAS